MGNHALGGETPHMLVYVNVYPTKHHRLSGRRLSVVAGVPECSKYQDGTHIVLHPGSCVRCGLSVQTRRLSVEPQGPAESSAAAP